MGSLPTQGIAITLTAVLLAGAFAAFGALFEAGLQTLVVYLVGIRWATGTASAHDAVTLAMSDEPPAPQDRPGIGAAFRVVGFTWVPSLFLFLSAIPLAGTMIRLVLAVWSLFVFFAGLGGLGIPTRRALLVLVLSAIVRVALAILAAVAA